jgi:UDP-N-acetylglucosamine--N-acetylmuramyl-(pentapeptide) pyrophosphoryl-undecaprenol N-acetylglucosamine transferase
MTGNPVREELKTLSVPMEEAFTCFPELDPHKKTILVIGGSLGARTLNESVLFAADQYVPNGVQVLWQCGKYYHETLKAEVAMLENPAIVLLDFIARMDAAYTVADVIVSRAGALSISELCLVGKPVILVPSPNVSEDHQTKNAMALVKNDAAILVKDAVAKEQVMQAAFDVLKAPSRGADLSAAIKKMARPRAAADIVDTIETIVKGK